MKLPKTIQTVQAFRSGQWHPGCLFGRLVIRMGANIASVSSAQPDGLTLVEDLLREERELSAVEHFARVRDPGGRPALETHYRRLLPARPPAPGWQYAFEVDLDRCSGCKACVSACHSLNGLEEGEAWRSVGLLISQASRAPVSTSIPGAVGSRQARPAAFPEGWHQHITSACHHCADPGCRNGCPVLAYDKDPVTGIVRHLDDQCMGCGYCIMKCPYEVPRYSERLGIVRKCDMCSHRLAVGEAPACVQACPDEAIRITLVETARLADTYRGNVGSRPGRAGRDLAAVSGSSGGGLFLPDAPDPGLTLPTTRYVTARTLPGNLVAADHGALRLDNPHWPLVFMLVFTQGGAGLFVASAILWRDIPVTALPVVGLGLLLSGLAAAPLHLGRPLKAWRAFLGWRRSWLSRELMAFHLFLGAGVFSVLAAAGPRSVSGLAGVFPLWMQEGRGAGAMIAAAALTGLLAVFASAMVYVDTGRPFWCARRVLGNFFGSTLLLGATFAAFLLAWVGGPGRFVQAAAMAALVLRTALFVWRRMELRRAWRNPASPIHFNARVIREKLPHTTVLRTGLFAGATAFGLLAILNAAGLSAVWAGVAACLTLGSEITGRHVFFVAGAAKRMPGGIVA
jgi:Fe-S-cluster-containing dehydrogenase component/DMSO reductase anchor subunit